jgi:hypothetical protein
MRMPSALLAFMLTFGVTTHAGAPALGAQQADVAAGTKLRFELRNGERHEGRVVSLGADGLEAAFLKNGATAKYPLADIARMEVVSGHHRPVMRGATIGFVAGASVGAVIGALSYDKPDFFIGKRSDAALFGAFLLGLPGLVVGGVQGIFPRDRWQEVRLDGGAPRFNVRSLPAGGSGVGLALAF